MTTYIPAEPAPYSWVRKAMKFKTTKVGMRALAKAEPVRFVERTDFADLRIDRPGGRYATLDELHHALGTVVLELRTFTGNVFTVKYDGKNVTFG